MTDNAIELTVDGTTLVGGALGAVVATLWSTAPVAIGGPQVTIITQNQNLFILFGTAIMAAAILYRARRRKGVSVPRRSLYTGVAAFLIVGAAGYATAPAASALQNQGAPTGQLTGDSLHVATLSVDGMTCLGCKMTVKGYLSEMDGVKQVDVSLPDREATVVYDASTVPTDELVNADVFRGAYTATVTADRQYSG